MSTWGIRGQVILNLQELLDSEQKKLLGMLFFSKLYICVNAINRSITFGRL